LEETSRALNFNHSIPPKKEKTKVLVVLFCFVFCCTIITSETELMERTYIVTPTVTGGPERRFKNKNKNILTSQKSAKKNDPHVVN
jgi:hypothetical protein